MSFTPRPLPTPAALQALMKAGFPLSDQQFAAVTAELTPAVVIAGAGSGKTTLMAARVVWLVGTGQVRPEEILGLTFTTKATAELAGRIRGALHEAGLLARGAGPGEEEAEALEPTVSTYNAYAAALLTEHGLRIGHEPDTRVITEAARYQLASRVVRRHTGEVRHLSDHPATVIGYLLSLDAQLSEHLVDPDDVVRLQDSLRTSLAEELALEHRSTGRKAIQEVLHTFDRRVEVLDLVRGYRRLKRSLGLMEFSDQIELGAYLARDHPEVGAAERAKFKVVLLDEYQDTSVAQALMLSSLFSGATAEDGRGHAVTAVGDPNQAIYGWRGASVSNILRFGESFPAADGARDVPAYPLTVNRRSDRRILELANRLAGPLLRELPLVRPLEAPAEAAPGELHAEVHESTEAELAALVTGVRAAHERVGSWKEIGVLTRDNATAAEVFAVLSHAEVPVEIVGLTGLLELPEVAEVVATLTLLEDLTANAALLLLLTGPRWSIGVRDLALLGERAAQLAGARAPGGRRDQPVEEELAEAVAGADPTEVASLCDALDDPGDLGYSPEALERFALLSAELRRLRQHVGEPLLDLVRRIVDTIGIDVELASSVSPGAAARRDNLDLFLKAVAEFQGIDGEVSLPALLGYLEAEEEGGTGMEIATPTAADTVKLLTVHRAKGLEWDAVFLVGVARDKFPTNQGRTKWTSGPGVLPSPLRGDAEDLPQLVGCSFEALKAFTEATREHEKQEELRLGYVAFTRPRHQLSVSACTWTASRKRPCGPSPYLVLMRDYLEELVATGELTGPLPDWPAEPVKGTPNPLQAVAPSAPWPVDHRGEEVERRLAAAALVRTEIDRLSADPPPRGDGRLPGGPGHLDDGGLSAAEQALVASWDRELDRLLQEARARVADVVEVPLPSSLSATSLAALRSDPQAFAASVARPMPRPPAPAARFGTRFHAWVEAHYEQHRQELLVDPDELSGRADLDVEDDADLRLLTRRFLHGPFADRSPVAIEPAFALVLDGQVVRGRIDAVFAEGDGSHLVVDWKTNRSHTADPLQLAVYRLAWAELRGIPVEQVRAAFYYVRDGEVLTVPDLPGRAALEALLAGADPRPTSDAREEVSPASR